MKKPIARLIQGLLGLLGIFVLFLAIDATIILVRNGHTHIWLAWFVGFVPGFALPFFTNLRWIYLASWVAAPILALLSTIIDER